MSSKLMVNLLDPSEIVIPDTDGSGTPDTGIFSIGQGTNNVQNSNALIITVIGLAVLLAIVAVTILLIKRHKKQKLVNNLGSSYNGMTLNTKRHLVPRLAGLFVLVLIAVFGFLNYNEKHMTNNVEAASDTLTVTTEDITAVNIEIENEAVFGMGESKVTVNTATEAGYTLMAYVDSSTTDLTNDSGDAITMLETSYSQALTDNTWGISLTRPESQEQTIFRGLPTAEKDAMAVKVSGSNATEAGDETTLYYAAYVTPDLEYGTYSGATINYIAVANVISDDVTVNYHGNGYYFDDLMGTDDLNTVKYGQSCELAYVGGSCRKVYTTTQPAEIVKTSNLNDDGTQNGPYRMSASGNYKRLPFIYKVVNIPNADGIRVEMKYGLSTSNNEVYVIVNTGEYNYETGAGWSNDYEEVYTYGNGIAGTEIYEFDGDTITIFGLAYGEPVEGYDYGVYAKVYPIYNSEPEDIETVATTVCNFAKSENLDDEGHQIRPYPYEQYNEYYDEWGNYWGYQTITIPGATKIRAVVDYSASPGFDLEMIEGYYEGKWEGYQEIYVDSEDQPVSGTEEYVFNGSTVTFYLSTWMEPMDGYDYGFYAQLIPYYEEELEDTMPEQICKIARTEGDYIAPVGYNSYYGYVYWYIVSEEDGWYYVEDGPDGWLRGEESVLDYIRANYDSLEGKTIDVYVDNYYRIEYAPNGANGYWRTQEILPHTTEEIWSNNWSWSGYSFVGWNTKADGSGKWYYPGDAAMDLAEPGYSITLYAQWQYN